jgi:hypothetical protein
VVIFAAVIVLGSEEFRLGFETNFLATVAGVALGVQVAVMLASAQDRAERGRVAAEAIARRGQVLTAIQRELEENRTTLSERRSSGSREFAIPFLQDQVWVALSDGGELRWVEDPALIRQIARGYLYVGTINFLERQAFELIHSPTRTMRFAGGVHPVDAQLAKITSYLDHQDGVATAAIDEALAAIRPVLRDNEPR